MRISFDRKFDVSIRGILEIFIPEPRFLKELGESEATTLSKSFFGSVEDWSQISGDENVFL